MLSKQPLTNAYLDFRRKWEDQWSATEYDPNWRITEIPSEIQDAVESGWFRPGASILDVGCGSGEVAAWLAGKQFDVLGIDLAKGAIARAKQAYSHIRHNLEFRVMDICQEAPAVQRFEAVIDRGCLHTIPKDFVPNYVQHVAESCVQGATFLLFFRTWERSGELPVEIYQQRAIDLITTQFCTAFEIINIQPTIIPRTAGQHPESPVPVLAIWLQR